MVSLIYASRILKSAFLSSAALTAAESPLYGICYKGNSCVDPPQAALGSLLDSRYPYGKLFGSGMDSFNRGLSGINKLIPNDFVDGLSTGINQINNNLFQSWFGFGPKKKGFIEVGDLRQISNEEYNNGSH